MPSLPCTIEGSSGSEDVARSDHWAAGGACIAEASGVPAHAISSGAQHRASARAIGRGVLLLTIKACSGIGVAREERGHR